MKILRVVGLGLAIIMLKFLVPRVFSGLESVLLAFFGTLTDILTLSKGSLRAAIGEITPTVPLVE